jgi:nucleoside-diphosphate-sugar epimerase
MPSDVVVMAAALTPEKGRDTGTLVRNLRMAEHVGAAVLAQSLGQLVYFSSDAVYASQAFAMDESTPAAPGDLYGLMHRARELILRDATDRAGIPFCVLRPCAIFGPGDSHNSYGPNRFVRTALKERKIQVFGLGEDTRDHVYIDDVVSLTLKAIAHRSSGRLNIVSGNAVAFAELAKRVARLAGGRTSIESLPQKGPVSHRSFDAASIQAAFPGFIPTSLDGGLERTIEAASRA